MQSIANAFNAVWRATPFASDRPKVVSRLSLNGVIGDVRFGRRGLSAERVAGAVEAAFKPKNIAAVALAINSPGGSPVQSKLIFQAIRRAAEKYEKPVIAFIEDVGASGGYMLAIAGDEIYADDSSIIGSIGVIAAGFGFQEAIARLGVERRVHTAGAAKSQLDPFRAEDPADVERLTAILDQLHENFIELVRARRKDKLSSDEDIFTGAFWPAAGAQARGLIDGIAHLDDFLRERYGDDVKIKKVELHRGSLLRRLMVNATGGLIDVEDAIAVAETRALWARYGL